MAEPARPARDRRASSKRGGRGPGLQARAARTRDQIECAALALFSEVGFDAASTREIAARAGVKQQLITYHYGTKLDLWKAAVDRVFDELQGRLDRRIEGLEGVDAATQVRLVLREFILFNAEHPEVIRFMLHEGARPGPRLDWLNEQHTREVFELLKERIAWAQAHDLAPEADPDQLTYAFMGAVSMFSQGTEFELLTGGKSIDPGSIESYADLVLRLVLPGTTGSDASPA